MNWIKGPCLGRREASKLERRAAIVEIAKRSFVEQGYAGTTMSAIAAELGGSKGTLWSYFASKEELFAAVLDEATTAFRGQLDDVLRTRSTLAETVRGFCRSFIEKITSIDGMSLHRMVVAESGRFPEVGKIFSSRGPEPVRQLLTDYFADQIGKGALRRDDPLHVATVLVSLCMGHLYQRTIWENAIVTAQEIDDEASYVAEVFLRAFAPVE